MAIEKTGWSVRKWNDRQSGANGYTITLDAVVDGKRQTAQINILRGVVDLNGDRETRDLIHSALEI